jgi:hypothetical protein
MENRFTRFSSQSIETLNDVKNFAQFLIEDLHLNFHPDDDFCYYASDDSQGLNATEIAQGNAFMESCFEVCEKEHADIYEVMGAYLHSALQSI